MLTKFKSSLQVLIAIIFVFGAIGIQSPTPVNAVSTGVIISEVYGGGGNSGSTYTNDFVELYNLGTTTVDLSTWSLQYASSTGTSWNMTKLVGSIAPGKYYLIQQAAGAGGTTPLPTPDATGTATMSGTAGKVALVSSQLTLNPSSGSPFREDIVDFVGFGTANVYEGSGPTPAPSNSNSVSRTNVCVDADDNASEFTAGLPTPSNTSAAGKSCASLVTVVPADGTINVAIESGITVTYSRPVYPSTGAFALSDGTNSVPVTVTTTDNINFTIQPDAALAYLTQYTFTITGSSFTPPVTNPAVATYSFRTMKDPSMPPAVLSIEIPGDLTWLDPSPTVKVTFDEPVSPQAVWYDVNCGGNDYTANLSTTDTTGSVFNFTTVTPFALDSQCTFKVLGANVAMDTQDKSLDFRIRANMDDAPVFNGSTPTSGSTLHTSPEQILLNFSEAVTIDTTQASLVCSVETPTYSIAATADPAVWALTPGAAFKGGQTCTLSVPAAAVSDSDELDPPDKLGADIEVVLSFGEMCSDPYTTIMAIQGSGTASPMVGQTVTTMGVVTLNTEAGKKGFYIQDLNGDGDPSTSDGLMVYSGNNKTDYQPGQLVRVTGKVVEYYNMTEISPLASSFVCGENLSVTPVELSLPFADTAAQNLEAYEGMVVRFAQGLVINEYYQYGRYGELVLGSKRIFNPTNVVLPGDPARAMQAANDLDRIMLEDGNTAENPEYLPHPGGGRFCYGELVGAVADCPSTNIFRGGDTLTNLAGVVDFAFGQYKVIKTQPATYTATNPRTEAPDLVAGELRVSSINTLNYFMTLTSAGNKCGPAGNAGCRGADDETERLRQRAKTVAAVTGMASDVTGLLEIENDSPDQTTALGADYAIADIVAGLNATAGAGTYAYIPTGAIGTDVIKAGILYKPARVTPVGSPAYLTKAIDPTFIDTCNRPVLAQTFQDNITGEKFTFAVNHLKSKGSACSASLNSALDQDLGDGQSFSNYTRTQAMIAQVKWLETDPTGQGSDMYLIMGDLNSYAMEDPMFAAKKGADGVPNTADDYIDLVERFKGIFNYPPSYGYVFNGQAGYLDGALANRKLAGYVLDAKEWHINADETSVLDYNTSYTGPEGDKQYAPDAYRSSDHDPILISLMLNHEPVPADDSYQTKQETKLVVSANDGVLANDTDPNIYDKITASLVAQPANGTVEMRPDGSFTYLPKTGFVGDDTFDYTMHADPGLMSAYANTATVTIKVTANQTPVLGVILPQTVNEAEQLSVQLTASDPDGDALSFTMTNAPTGAAIDAATMVFTWTPDENYGGQTLTVKVCVSDGSSNGEACQDMVVTVVETNQSPVLGQIPELLAEVDKAFSYQIPASDSDLPAQPLSFSLEGTPPAGMSLSNTGLLTWTPALANADQIFNLSVKVCDNASPQACVTQPFVLKVGGDPNPAPTGLRLFLPIIGK